MLARFGPAALALCLCIAAAPALTGCSDETAARSVASIQSIHGGQILDSDVYNNGKDAVPGTGDDYIVEDQVAVTIRNSPHDPGLNLRPDGPYGAVTFYRYEVRFQGEEDLSPIVGSIHLRVATGSTGSGEVTIVPAGYKTVPPLLALRDGGEIRLNAEVTLIGEEDDSREEIRAIAILPVHCANWAD